MMRWWMDKARDLEARSATASDVDNLHQSLAYIHGVASGLKHSERLDDVEHVRDSLDLILARCLAALPHSDFMAGFDEENP
jgi:hypothetical protein